jgi:hypothetical protein
MVVAGLMVVGILKIYMPALSKLSWLVNLSGFYLFGFSIILLIHKRRFPPVLIWPLVLFAYGILTALINGVGILAILLDLKRSFSAWGLFLAAYVIHFSSSDIERIKKFVYLLVLFQLPFCLHQYIVLVPLRETVKMAGEYSLTPVDIIVGTFGGKVFGGGANSTLAVFLIIALSMLLSLKKTQIKSAKYIFLLVIIVLPLFLGETRIVVVYLMVVFVIVYGKDIIQKPSKFFINSILMFLFIGSLVYLFFVAKHTTIDATQGHFANFVAKNFGDLSNKDRELNRTTVLIFWASEQRYFSWANTLVGHGIGATSSTEKTGGGLAASAVGSLSKRYPNYGIDYTSASIILWELGIIGVLLFIGWFSSVWILIKRIEYTAPASILYQINGLKVGTIIFIINMFAKSSFHQTISHQVLFAIFMSYPIILRYRSRDL